MRTNPKPDDEARKPVPFAQMGDELLERARETAKKIKERVKKAVGDPKGSAETKEMPTVDTKEMPIVPPEPDAGAAPPSPS